MKKKLIKGFAVVLTCAGLLGAVTGCGADHSDYDADLKNGYEKYLTGGEMTEKEYKAVKNFNNWKAKQGTKTYDDWDD